MMKKKETVLQRNRRLKRLKRPRLNGRRKRRARWELEHPKAPQGTTIILP